MSILKIDLQFFFSIDKKRWKYKTENKAYLSVLRRKIFVELRSHVVFESHSGSV